MANENAVQPREPRWLLWLALGGSSLGLLVVLVFYVSILLEPTRNNPENPTISLSAIPVIFWPWCALLPFKKRTEFFGSRISDAALNRAFYTGLCILFLFHVAIAFHLGHGWSHRDAFERTERISGFGPGIFVSYLFLAVWVADAIWAWAAFDSYLSRPRWLSWTIIGFMGFVWFNAVFVFGSWLFRVTTLWFGLTIAFNFWWTRYTVRNFLKRKASENAHQ